MIRKAKLLKQVSVGCLTILLSGSLNTLAVFATTTQASDTPNKSIVEPQDDSPAQTTTPEGATSDPISTPESDTSNQPLTPESDTHDQPASSLEPLPSNAKLPSSQMPQPVKSEVKATTTSQKKENPDTPTVSAEKDKSMSSTTRTLRRANPEEGTPGLVYNEDYTQVTGYRGKQTNIVIPEGVTSIRMFAFELVDATVKLTSVKFPSSLTSIGYRAFSSNELSSVTLPSSLTSIGGYAFSSNELSSVTLPSSLTSIGDYAFSHNELSSITLPSSLTSIGDYAFFRNKLSSITLPSSLTSIGDYAFFRNKLSSVTLPSSLTSIGYRAFSRNELSSVTLPSSLTSIGDFAFYDNKLSSVTLPSSLTSIGEDVFSGNQLTSVTIPDSVTSIGSGAFSGNQLTSVTIPDSVTSIGYAAFWRNQITGITVPDSVTEVAEYIAGGQSTTIVQVRYASYTTSELGISTHYKTDRPAKLTSQTKGVTIDGDSVKLDPSFTGSEFIVKWSAWDERHTGTLTVKLVDAVEGKITYLDDAGKTLLADKDVSSIVTGTFDWMTPEPISDYTVDLERSQILTLSDTGLQTISLKDKLVLTQKTTPEELIDYLKQQPIAPGTQSVELRYVYTKNPAKKGQVTVEYVDTDGRAVAEDKVLSGIVGRSYITERLEIDGYTLKTIYGKSIGEYTLEPQVVRYVYTKADKQPVIPIPDNKQPVIPIPDNKQPDNKQPDNKQPDNKQPDNKQPDNKTPNSKPSDKKDLSDEKIPAKQVTQPTKVNPLPKTGESQKASLIQLSLGVVMVLLSISFVGLRMKRK